MVGKSSITIPKNIENLLIRRRRLAISLQEVCAELDEYCYDIGLDINDPDKSIYGDISIYEEPGRAYDNTKNAIKKKLKESY